MQEIKLNKKNKVEVLQMALEVLHGGGTIVYPTETSYGLGANFFDPKAIAKIYKIKARDKKNYLSVIVPDYKYATSIVRFSHQASELAKKYWPGALTLVLPFRHSDWKNYFPENLALRVSSNFFVQDLVRQLGYPLVATSANLSNMSDSYSTKVIVDTFANSKFKPDLFINAGNLKKEAPSTIVSFAEGNPKILRQGKIKIKF